MIMDSRKVRIGTYLYEQSLYLVVSGFSRSAMRFLLAALSCYCALWATPLFACNAALVQDQPPLLRRSDITCQKLVKCFSSGGSMGGRSFLRHSGRLERSYKARLCTPQ